MESRDTPKTHLHPALSSLAQVAILFLPGIPAYLWVWPNVGRTAWLMPVQIAVYLYFLAGCLFIGLRHWNLRQLGLGRQEWRLSLICGVLLTVGRALVLLALDWPLGLRSISLNQLAGDVLFFGLVGLVEELLFRGLIYHALGELHGARLAIWGSALAFGLYHVGGSGLLGGLGTFIIGVILGLIRWRAGGIAGLILVHALMDVATKAMLSNLNIQHFGPPQVIYPVFVILGYGLILGVPLYLWKGHPLVERMLTRQLDQSQFPARSEKYG